MQNWHCFYLLAWATSSKHVWCDVTLNNLLHRDQHYVYDLLYAWDEGHWSRFTADVIIMALTVAVVTIDVVTLHTYTYIHIHL